MSNVHGWTVLAGAVVALAGGATTAQGASAAARPPRPALAVGRSADSSWRLEGRSLTVRLTRPLFARSRDRRVRVIVRCGDGVYEDVDSIAEGRSFFARAAGATPWVSPQARTLRVRLGADVANAATYCKLEDWEYDGYVQTRGAWMRTLRGSAPRCERMRGERLVFGSPTALVVARTADSASVEEGEVVRACMRPNGRSFGIAENWDGGGAAGGSADSVGYVSAGRWLAWGSSWSYHFPGAGGGGSVALRDLADGWAPLVGFDADGLLALTARGVAVLARALPEADAPDGTRRSGTALLVGSPDGRTTELDRVGADGRIDQVAVSADGGTVRWLNGTVERSALLPTP